MEIHFETCFQCQCSTARSKLILISKFKNLQMRSILYHLKSNVITCINTIVCILLKSTWCKKKYVQQDVAHLKKYFVHNVIKSKIHFSFFRLSLLFQTCTQTFKFYGKKTTQFSSQLTIENDRSVENWHLSDVNTLCVRPKFQ